MNYLTSLKSPPIGEEHMYDASKSVKSDYTYIKGLESHLVRRKMILTKYPQIAQLLIADKPYTILITLALIAFMLINGFWAKVTPFTFRIKIYGCSCLMPISLEAWLITPCIAAFMTSFILAVTKI